MLIDIMNVLNFFAVGWIIFIFVFLFLSLVFKFKGNKMFLKFSIFITIFAFSVFAFNYEPSEYTDLYRHYLTLDLIRDSGAKFYYSHEIITSFLYSIVASTKYNGLLPFLVTIIRYSLFFAILYKYVKTYNVSSYSTRLFVFFSFAFFPFIESISGVRYYFAVTVLVYALINEYFFNKKLFNKILSFVPLLIHTSSGMYLGIKILNIRKIHGLLKYLLLFWTFFYQDIARLLQSIGSSFTNTAANLLIFYIEEEREISLRLTIARFVMILLILIMLWLFKKKDKSLHKTNLKYYNFVELILYFTLGTIFQSVFFQRNVFFVALICMPLFLNFFNSEFISRKVKIVFTLIILLLSVGMYSNQIYGLIMGYF